ncbi:MAG: HAMP domain-containing histidine kinase [Ruminococcus sp.]|nr:HAMP domain-containing histidine kinase [Ruminococcus sp.]
MQVSKYNKFGKHSITKHWLWNSLSVVSVVLIIIEVLLIAVIRNYYYSSAKQYVTSKMNVITSSVMRTSDDGEANHNTEIRALVEGYAEKDKIELMAIKTNGRIDITSSGFSPDRESDLSDYDEAKKASNGTASQIFDLSTGEKVIAVTSVISLKGSEYDALRMVTSMKNIDKQIMIMTIIITAVVICIILIIFFSGRFFIRSIVYPVIRIGQITRKFAKGDFTERIEKTSDDELGELCDSINYMAEELSNTESMKNEFISSISHELRTPLTAIKGWSETLTTIDDRETFIKGMRVITSETERLSQMVEELLDFSRIQDNRLTLTMDTIDILAELTETVLIYQERARALGITLNYYEPVMLPFVNGDKNRLRQVFINIVDNAIKYSDKGDTVSVEAYEQNNEICISVSDTGIGISKEDLPKVKTKFFKANQTRRGSGIGLAVADEIISRHNGTLVVNSEEGVGTTVLITLPCIEQKKEPDNHETVNVELISSDSLDERNNIDEQ